MKFQVWHCEKNRFQVNEEFFSQPLENNFSHVANVEAESIDHVFQLTNTIHHPWWENSEVEFLSKENGARSTSVGDVVVNTENHKKYMCDYVGWKEF